MNETARSVLVTGHTGFKGSWLTLLLREFGHDVKGLSLAPAKSSLYSMLYGVDSKSNEFVDIRNKTEVARIVSLAEPEIVIHLAAQALVLDSYERPADTFETNIQGTVNLLNALADVESIKTVLVITTDKVYRNLGESKRFRESDCLAGVDPYSASKVGTEAVCSGWRNKFCMTQSSKLLVARAGNVIGGGDLSKYRLLPDLIKAYKSGEKLIVRNPFATRPWQHVLDPLFGYLGYIDFSLSGEVPNELNFGPKEAGTTVQQVLNWSRQVLEFEIEEDQEHSGLIEAAYLDLDSSLAKQSIGWEPKWNQEEAVYRTLNWWKRVLNGSSDVKRSCDEDILEYLGAV